MLSTWFDSLELGFIAKQRSGLGFDYMLFAQMRGNDPRTL